MLLQVGQARYYKQQAWYCIDISIILDWLGIARNMISGPWPCHTQCIPCTLWQSCLHWQLKTEKTWLNPITTEFSHSPRLTVYMFHRFPISNGVPFCNKSNYLGRKKENAILQWLNGELRCLFRKLKHKIINILNSLSNYVTLVLLMFWPSFFIQVNLPLRWFYISKKNVTHATCMCKCNVFLANLNIWVMHATEWTNVSLKNVCSSYPDQYHNVASNS